MSIRGAEIASIIGVALFVATIVAVPVAIARMDRDHFVAAPPERSALGRAVRAVLGLTMVALGVLMLVLPGQGLLTIFLGLVVADLPFQRRLMAALVRRPAIARAIQSLRRRAGKEPLLLPRRP